MKLDHTFIAIRERGILEICDLALQVIRDHFKPLVLLLIFGALPWIVADWLITGWLVTDIFRFDYGPTYYWMTFLLVVSQAQVGTTFITYYLGQAMFVGRPGIRQTIRGTFRVSPYFFWIHGIVRLVVPILFLGWLTRYADEDVLFGLSLFVLPLLVAITMLVRGLRPFVSEMLLLEKTPISVTEPGKVNFKRRSQSLHAAASSDLFGRALVTSLFLIPMTFAFFAMYVTIDSTLNLQANSEISLFAYYWIAALWMSAAFAAVVHFSLTSIFVFDRKAGLLN